MLHLILTRTKVGTAIRAASYDMDMVSVLGVNLDMLVAVLFLIAGGLGGMAGVFGYRDVDFQVTKNFDLTRGMSAYVRWHAAVSQGLRSRLYEVERPAFLRSSFKRRYVSRASGKGSNARAKIPSV